MRKFVSAALVIALAVCLTVPTESAYAGTKSLRAKESNYIKSLAVTSGTMKGAIRENKSGNYILPYFDDFACLGLVAYGRRSDRQTVLNYINWHISHMNTKAQDKYGVAGTIYDYNNGVSTGDYDSTDSYAATFLELLAAYTKTYDHNFLKDKSELVDTLTNVMLSTYISKIGLCKATPGYDECILMDNCEVYKGFVSAKKIYSTYCINNVKARSMSRYAAKTRSAIIKRYWSKKKGCFYTTVDIKGRVDSKVKLSRFYLDSSSQLYPVIYGVISPKSKMAKKAYAKFKKYYVRKGVKGRNWANCSVKGSGGYPWCILLNGTVKMKDKKVTKRFKKSVTKKYINKNHKYPYYCGEAGQLLIALSK